MYKWLHKASIPSWLRWLLYILLTLSCVYWICMLTYKLLEITRKILHFISDKRNWWTFIVCVLICLIIAFIFAQFVFDLDPVGNVIAWFNAKWNYFIEYLKSKLI